MKNIILLAASLLAIANLSLAQDIKVDIGYIAGPNSLSKSQVLAVFDYAKKIIERDTLARVYIGVVKEFAPQSKSLSLIHI